MSFKLVVRNKLRVPVKGELKGEDGKPVKFDFVLICKRLNQVEMDAAIKDKESSVDDFLQAVSTGWEGVLQDDGSPLEFSTENLANVLLEAAMRMVCYGAYLKEVGAIAKN